MKRRSIVLALIVAFFATFLGISRPAAAATSNCISGTNTFTTAILGFNSPSFSVNVGDVVSVTMSGSGTSFLTPAVVDGFAGYRVPHTMLTAGSAYVHFFNGFGGPGGSGTVNWQVSINGGSCGGVSASGGVTTFNFTDGRLNSHDGAQTAAAYCEDGGVSVYAVVKSVGTLAFKVTKVQLAAVPAKPAHNTLIKSALGVSLYRLTTGELQINAPDSYVFVWDGCSE